MQAGLKAGESLTGIDELLGGSDGALAQLRLAARRIERGAADHPLLGEALAALDRALIEACEAEDKIARAADVLTFDPARLDAAEARLFDIRGLARKHRIEADALAMSGGWSPIIHLACHRGAKPVWSEERAAFLAPERQQGLSITGSAAGLGATGACLGDGAAKAVEALRAIGRASCRERVFGYV